MPLDGTGYRQRLSEDEAEDLRILRAARHWLRFRWRWSSKGAGHFPWQDCAGMVINRFSRQAHPMMRVTGRLLDELPDGYSSVPNFNDDPRVKHADVRALFYRAILKLEAKQ